MAGLIKDEDIQLVRERTRIDEVIGQYVTLKSAGGGSLKGLCPFHDEKSPSFNVRPAQGYYHCFGCGVGGDAIKFLREIEGITFAEAVERLADKSGIQLRYEEGATPGPRRDVGQRQRLLEAHKLAQEFYAAALGSAAEAQAGRDFIKDRGFDQSAAEVFGVGFAPRSGEALVAHLKGKGLADEDLLVGGLASRGQRGLYDRFRGRLLWPIRDISGETIGFGARRLFDDDRVEAKYLNTSETPIYKKSNVLYGIDLARRQIAATRQAVIVEGYTDVMACHLAGVPTAVATCGTAFGEDHARVLRRVLLDQDAFHGEVIFTFDGDEAGRRAAMKAFSGDQQFVAQTYVAVEPRGMDPCDLRLADGDAAVRELVASRIPLYRFVLDNTLERYDLDRADQRIDAVREAVTLTRAIRDKSKVEEFLREVATKVGLDIEQVRGEHRRAKEPAAARPSQAAPAANGASAVANFGAAEFSDEREVLKALAQFPQIAVEYADELADTDFTHPVAQELWRAITKLGLPRAADASWVARVESELASEDARRILAVAAVQPLRAREESTERVVAVTILQLRARTLARLITDLKSKLQRTDPVEQAEAYNGMFGDLISLEQQHRSLRDRVIGN
ncbi:MAG TPA: DNA primase [Aeromicrobium sp.]|nr:DNA primase [Aeromicrobium sp.]HKY58628.1 DNA primase [Aeromicrobium sp.]